MALARNAVLVFIALVAVIALFSNVSYFNETASSTLNLAKKQNCRAVDNKVTKSLSSHKDERFQLRSMCYYVSFYPLEDKAVWNHFRETDKLCESIVTLKPDHMTAYQNNDETKHHMDPIDLSQVKDCNIVTLGIGHDVTVEKKLKEKFNQQCKFLGVDPITVVNEDIYKAIGDYFPFAVGNETKIEATSVKADPDTVTYTWKNFTHVEFVEFLRDRAKLPEGALIDQLFLDIEYAEYPVLDYFHLNNKLDQAGYTICQINGEFHNPSKSQQAQFGKFVKQIAKDGRYLFFHEIYSHIRLYFVNVQDDRCYERYVNGRI
ncbi:hypothetical protein L596_026529 [Steinernema carpocapsae]|uniref:Methyltransferase FkbM domain-containing protein n=1 Tax=Steinernema carpocapsae TaxID=34508 RepID=A0A4U5M1N2_STECR|nr:hypothetical protein L596_026529 [Steinernema carpocapsae]